MVHNTSMNWSDKYLKQLSGRQSCTLMKSMSSNAQFSIC